MCVSRANVPSNIHNSPLFTGHNGPLCSHSRVPIFNRGVLPTSSSIQWRRVKRACSLAEINPPSLSHLWCDPTPQGWRRLADVQTVSQECFREAWCCVLMSPVPRVRTTVSQSSEQRPFNATFTEHLSTLSNPALPFVKLMLFHSWVTLDWHKPNKPAFIRKY